MDAPNDPSNAGPSRRRAAVLSYDAKHGDAAPRVVAKGYGHLADMIVARAHEAGLYVHTAPAMVDLLMQVDLDARIPPALYRAVAELLAWLYALESVPDAVSEPLPHDATQAASRTSPAAVAARPESPAAAPAPAGWTPLVRRR